jgi:hypothetical protein
MQGVEVDIDGEPAGTADAGDKDDVIFAVTFPVNHPNQCLHKNADAAAGTPYMRESLAGAEVFMDEVFGFSHG